MVYLLALLSPLAFAAGTVLQQRGTLETSAGEGDPRFLAQMLREPVWLFGGFLTVCGWTLQAAALRSGGLSLVQALQTLSLVFALPFGAWLTRQHVTRRSATGAGLTVLGLSVFVFLGDPHGGISQPGTVAWLTAGLAAVAVTAGLTWLALTRRGPLAAALFGIAAGILFALQAALTKLLVMELGHGAVAILIGWPLYAFVLTAGTGFVLQQASLKTGSLAPAMAALEAATLAISLLLAITVFREAISGGKARLLPVVGGLGLVVAGVAILAYEQKRP